MHISIEVFKIFPDPLYWEMDTFIDPIPLTASRLDFSATRLSSEPSVSRSSIPDPTGKVMEFHLAWRVVTLQALKSMAKKIRKSKSAHGRTKGRKQTIASITCLVFCGGKVLFKFFDSSTQFLNLELVLLSPAAAVIEFCGLVLERLL